MGLNKIAFAALAAAMVSGSARASYNSTVLSDNPLAYYQLDDSGTTLADSSGNNHNGAVTETNAPGDPTRQTASLIPTDPSGFSTTFKNGGTNASVAGFDHSGTGFSVEFSMKLTGTPSVGEFYNLVGDRTGGLDFELMVYLNVTGGNIYFRPHYQTTNGFGNPDITADPLTVGETYHVVSTYSTTANAGQGEQDFYINGQLVYSAVGNGGSLIDTSNPLYFGQDPQGDGSTAPVVLDDVAIYNYALSAGQVATHFAAVPEPTSLALAGIAGFGLLGRRNRRNA